MLVSQDGTPVDGTVRYDDSSCTLTYIPTSDLSPGTTYTVTLADTLEDLSGNAFAGESWNFTVGVRATAEENNSLTLICAPSGQVINEVTFASYVTPGGSYGFGSPQHHRLV